FGYLDVDTAQHTGFVNEFYSNFEKVDGDFIGTLFASADNPSFDMHVYLGVQSFGGSRIDYSHTATISLLLPQGVSFTSGSGASLTERWVAPEPATGAMMSTVFLLIGGLNRRDQVHALKLKI